MSAPAALPESGPLTNLLLFAFGLGVALLLFWPMAAVAQQAASGDLKTVAPVTPATGAGDPETPAT